VTATQKFLVDRLVTRAAIAGSKVRADDKAVMIDLLLASRRLMAIQAVHAFFGVGRHFILVNNRILQTRMALGAFARGTHKVRGRLLGFSPWTRAVYQERRDDEPERNDDSNKHRTE